MKPDNSYNPSAIPFDNTTSCFATKEHSKQPQPQELSEVHPAETVSE